MSQCFANNMLKNNTNAQFLSRLNLPVRSALDACTERQLSQSHSMRSEEGSLDSHKLRLFWRSCFEFVSVLKSFKSNLFKCVI